MPKGLQNAFKIVVWGFIPSFSEIGRNLRFERPYVGLALNSKLRGVKADTEAFEKPSQHRALKKTTKIRARISFFRKS